MNNQWVQSANEFYIREVSQHCEELPTAIYKIDKNPMTGELYLSQVQESFDFPYKVYGIETGFINRVAKTYQDTKGNLGILLNGVKGTGKTVTSKQICNKLKLPVLLVHTPYEGIPNFINNIQQDVIVFVDEFEKVYHDRDHSVLSIMDGAMDNGFRRVFLLTTNELYINSNMIQRPGRIRYLKTYSDLSLEAIMEIVDDKLVHKKLREATIEFISELEIITVDIVKAIVEEVNIHEEDPKLFKDVFNVKTIEDKVNVYEITPTSKTPNLRYPEARVSPRRLSKELVGYGFEINGRYKGEIISILDEDEVVVEEVQEDENGDDIAVHKRYKIEVCKQKHHAFYAF